MRKLLKALLLLFLLPSAFRLAWSKNVPSNVTIINAEDLRGRPYFSIADALEGVGVIDIQRVGGRGTQAFPKMRGLSNSNNVLVLVDGAPLNGDFGSQVDLAQLPVNMAERIEITRGGAPSSYGPGAIGGVINIVTSRPKEKGLDTRLGTSIGRDGVKDHHGRLLGRNFFADLTYLASRETSGGFASNEASENTNHFGNITRSFNGDGFWGVEYYYQESKTGLPNGTNVPFDQWNGHEEQISRDPSSFRDHKSNHVRLYLASPEIMDGRFHATAYRSARKSDERSGENNPSLLSIDARTSGGQGSFRRNGLELGGDINRTIRDVYPDPKRDAVQTGFFIRNKFEFGALTILPGVRTDNHSQAGSVVSPRAALMLAFNPTTLLSVTAERGARFPGLDELYSSSGTTGSTSLDPEKSTSYDGGIQWTPTTAWDFKITSFYIKKSDAIRPNTLTGTLHNEGFERSTGFEADISWKTRLARIQLRGTHLRARQSQGNGSLADSPLTPRRHGLASIDLFLPRKLTLTNEWRFQGEQFSGAGQTGIRIPSYQTWNVRIVADILTSQLFFEADNVLGERYADTVVGVPPVLSPQPDRTFWAGLTIFFKN